MQGSSITSVIYRSKLCCHFISLAEDEKPLNITGRQSLQFISESWSEVKQSTIAKSWKHVQILPTSPTSASSSTSDDSAEEELQLLINNLPASLSPNMSASQYVNIDCETEQLLSDSDILQLVQPNEESADSASTSQSSQEGDKEREPAAPPAQSLGSNTDKHCF